MAVYVTISDHSFPNIVAFTMSEPEGVEINEIPFRRAS